MTTDTPTTDTPTTDTPTAAAPEPIDVAVVVVTHQSDRVLEGLVASLPAGMAGVRWTGVVVDNASTDRTVDIARGASDLAVVPLRHNVGFAAAVNRGVTEAAPHRAVLVLNPDVRLHPGCAAALYAAVAQPAVGIAVPRLHEPDGTVARSLRRAPTVRRALGEALLGGTRSGRWPAAGEVVTSPASYRSDGPADWATGAVWMIDAACWRDLHGFDTRYFLYWEEVDFALRAADAGYGLRYTGAAAATHLGGASGHDPALYALLTRNRARGFTARHGALHGAAYRGVLLVGELLRSARGRTTSRAAVRALLGDPGVLPVAASAPTTQDVAQLTRSPVPGTAVLGQPGSTGEASRATRQRAVAGLERGPARREESP